MGNQDKKVLVTGGSGYIGSVLIEHLLDKEYRVTCLDNLTFGPQSLMHLINREGFEFVYGDVRDKKTLEDIVPKHDVLIPLAGIVGAPQCKRNTTDAISVNRGAVVTMNEIRSKNQMLLYPNTNSGYGTTTGEIFCTEESPLNPISLYGKTKIEAEKALLESDKGSVSFRLATVFGMSPRMRTDLLANNFVLKAVTDGYIVVFEKEFKRNFVHVADVAACFEHSISNYEKMVGRAFNLGNDNANLSKKELVERIKIQVPNLSITYDEIGTDVDKRNYIVSNERLRKSGFEATIDMDYGIKEMIRGYELMFSAEEVFRQ